jgi:Flp pilus assembly pilin Flp
MIETLLNYIRPPMRDQHGQTFAEYALLLAGLSLALLLVFQPLGVSLQGLLNTITDAL